MIFQPGLLDRLIVPLDGSPAAETILSEARRFLRRSDSEIVLVRAEFPVVTDLVPGLVVAGVGEARAYLERVGGDLEEQGVRVRIVAESGPAAEVILRTVADRRGTLIAMSTHGRTGAARAVMGSVAEQVLRRSPVPVLAVRTLSAGSGAPVPPDERLPLRNILLPLDRSERSLRALAPAADLCRLFGARLLLLHVLDRDEDQETSEAYFRAVETRVGSQGVAVTTLIETGRAADEILDVARFHDADLIAMATHGRRGLARLAMGSVTEEVLRKAFVPVLAVRTTSSTAREGVA
ncbi:MAG TPA: universal stress protein [Planctomycetota bacterium]|nr:universal stress protein [Planctomycetota bacterium]